MSTLLRLRCENGTLEGASVSAASLQDPKKIVGKLPVNTRIIEAKLLNLYEQERLKVTCSHDPSNIFAKDLLLKRSIFM